MTFKESYKKLTKDGKKVIDQLDGTNDAESAEKIEKIANDYSKLKESEQAFIDKIYFHIAMEINCIDTILEKWNSSIENNNVKESLVAQRKLLEKGYISELRYTIDDTLKATYQEVLVYKNYLESSREDYCLMGLAFLSKLQGNNISGENVGNTGGFQGKGNIINIQGDLNFK